MPEMPCAKVRALFMQPIVPFEQLTVAKDSATAARTLLSRKSEADAERSSWIPALPRS